MNGVGIHTRAYAAIRLLLRLDYSSAVALKTKVFGDYNYARVGVSWITSTRGIRDGRRACRGGVIVRTMGTYSRGTGSNPVEVNRHFSLIPSALTFVFLWHTHTQILEKDDVPDMWYADRETETTHSDIGRLPSLSGSLSGDGECQWGLNLGGLVWIVWNISVKKTDTEERVCQTYTDARQSIVINAPSGFRPRGSTEDYCTARP